MNKYIIISNQNRGISSYLAKQGFKLIYTDCVNDFIDYEQQHADMQCLAFDNTVFVLKNATDLLLRLKQLDVQVIETLKSAKGTYPKNILLNALVIGRNIVGKINSLDSVVVEYAKRNGYNLINVNQGYTACSCCKISENAVITTDNSIYKALSYTDIDVLKISSNDIVLDKAKRGESGFIGGASCRIDDNTILFFGDITKHNDFESINSFLSKHRVSYDYIKNLSLTDIGGAVLLNI